MLSSYFSLDRTKMIHYNAMLLKGGISMLNRKEKKVLKDYIYELSERERALNAEINDLRLASPGKIGELEELDREKTNTHKQLLDAARVLNEGTVNWGEKAGDWVVRILGAAIPSAVGFLGVRWQTNRLIESEDKMGILTSQASKKMQTPHLPK